jgi:predicted RNA-binding Zn-ribbon protein involved in translation (DUF1610 family)
MRAYSLTLSEWHSGHFAGIALLPGFESWLSGSGAGLSTMIKARLARFLKPKHSLYAAYIYTLKRAGGINCFMPVDDDEDEEETCDHDFEVINREDMDFETIAVERYCPKCGKYDSIRETRSREDLDEG